MKTFRYRTLAWLTLLLALLSCGGGGGGGERGAPKDAARLDITLSRHVIDSGDTISVVVHIDDISQSYFMLKVRFPVGLRYVKQSSFLVVDDRSTDKEPGVSDSYDESNYLVYFLNERDFQGAGWAELAFQLKGSGSVEDGEIAVDADFDDPNIPNDIEFRPRNPNFTAMDQEWVEVKDRD